MTNGQIPSWLDVSNPKISVVFHRDIFFVPDSLPTFSSPAIELNLHHIPGLSDYFIYFNDDVFLGQSVQLSDFLSLQRGQKLFASWLVPDCAERCASPRPSSPPGHYSDLGNGVCDAPCDVAACAFDLGDCDAEPQSRGPPPPDASPAATRARLARLAAGEAPCRAECLAEWLGDGECDAPCDDPACFFDAGDCRAEPLAAKPPPAWRCVEGPGGPEGPGGSEGGEDPRGAEERRFAREGWGVSPDAFCVARVAMEGSFIQVELGETVETRRVQSVVVVESGFSAGRR